MAEQDAQAQTTTAASDDQKPTEISAALLKLVKRPGGKEGTERQVRRDEVLSFREYPDRVVVVTTDGQKFTGLKADEGKK